MPANGELFVIVGSRCVPRAVARVTRVDVKPFRAIDSDDACDEGEGDRSLAYWRAAHYDTLRPKERAQRSRFEKAITSYSAVSRCCGLASPAKLLCDHLG